MICHASAGYYPSVETRHIQYGFAHRTTRFLVSPFSRVCCSQELRVKKFRGILIYPRSFRSIFPTRVRRVRITEEESEPFRVGPKGMLPCVRLRHPLCEPFSRDP